MKKTNVKEKIEELKIVLLSLNAYGALDLKTFKIIENHIDALFQFKQSKKHD